MTMTAMTTLPLRVPPDEADPPRPLRWAVMGCARIAQKNVRAMFLSPWARLVAVASRDQARCEEWVLQHVPAVQHSEVRVFGSYEALLEDGDFDAVYVPLPTTLHEEWVSRIVAAGKHVLCEKPVGCTYASVVDMIRAARAKGVTFMDGVMFMHHPRLNKMLGQIFDPGCFWGPVNRVSSAFTFRADEQWLQGGDIRARASGDPLGCLGDLGWYCIRIAMCCFGFVQPEAARCVSFQLNADGVLIDLTAEVYWKNCEPGNVTRPNPVLHFHCSFLHSFRQWFEVCGNDRRITCQDFVLANTDKAEFVLERDLGLLDKATQPCADRREFPTFDSCQEAEMFSSFAKAVHGQQGTRDFYQLATLKTQAIVEAIAQSQKNGGTLVDVPAAQLP
uniref:Gfo/Idh/MocA-like oxidoreductase N-terminal domain-containing protein n=1 Tax=Rhizochromulina marina TaxID=1034831 RepID=A0A7S2S0Y6_9STRA|mmetsp:Transcript_23656/g.69235  ORF Transcript_23656/g.69235 Transcript_23656/m.69235 type:complete len:390 (+) Transcript_23656:1-1170(+)